MGVNDRNRAVLKCPKCNAVETIIAVEKGSVFGSAGWRPFDTPRNFEIVVQAFGAPAVGPIVSSAKCRACGCAAAVENT